MSSNRALGVVALIAVIAFANLPMTAFAGVLVDGAIDSTSIQSTTPAGGSPLDALTVYSDSTFNPADWTTTTFQSVNAAGVVTSQGQQLTGGDPGAYFGFSGSLSSFSGTSYLRVAHFTPNAVYNPATQGTITALSGGFTHGSFVFDNDVVFETGVIIRQNGKIYWPHVNWAYGLQGATGWYGSPTLYTNSPHANPLNWSVVGGPTSDNPNFSAGAAPIEFGFWTGYYFWNGTANVTNGVDNWIVNIVSTGVPEPTGVALLSLALLTAAARRRR